MRRLVGELRDEPVPELDWERMERELEARMARADALPTLPRAVWGGGRRTYALVAALAAVAAAAAVVFFVSREPGGGPERAALPGAQSVDVASLPEVASELGAAHPVAALAAGARIESGDEPVRFTLPGVATWELAPHSRLEVRSTEVPHLVSLEEGSIAAEVVPERAVVESFVVVAGGTRVAVHGTSFTVTRQAASVLVEVRRGSVAVGPASGVEGAERDLLVGPARAAYALETGKLARSWARHDPAPDRSASEEPAAPPRASDGAREEPAPSARPRSSAEPPPAGEPGASSEPPPAPASASASAPASAAPADGAPLSAAAVKANLSGCLGGAPAPEGTGGVVVHTDVTVYLDDAGRVTSVKFTPPLKPELQSCAYGVLGRRVEGATAPLGFGLSFTPRK
ncbi:MAG: FecR domain-containing protein [Polyangiaceae bacterium]|nr:FecR domain-containing protein [Polyangiaceae bacterium]